MRNESGFWSWSYQLFILYQFIESVFSKTVNTVLVILLDSVLSKICHWVAVCECTSVLCLSLFYSFFYYFPKFEIMNHHSLHSPCVFFTQVQYIRPGFHAFICVG